MCSCRPVYRLHCLQEGTVVTIVSLDGFWVKDKKKKKMNVVAMIKSQCISIILGCNAYKWYFQPKREGKHGLLIS